VKNLFEILKACGDLNSYNSLIREYHSQQLKYSSLKEAVAEALVAKLKPFHENLQQIQENKKDIKNQIKASSEKIRERARQTVKEVREIAGL